MSTIPAPLAAAAGATSQPQRSESAGQTGSDGSKPVSVEAGGEGGDRDADGRDLRRHDRPDLEEAKEEAEGVTESGGLDVSV